MLSRNICDKPAMGQSVVLQQMQYKFLNDEKISMRLVRAVDVKVGCKTGVESARLDCQGRA